MRESHMNRTTTPRRRARSRPSRMKRGAPRRPYCSDSLLQLIKRIAHDADAAALQELHDHRRVFSWGDSGALRLTEFLDQLRQSQLTRSWCAHDANTADRAYDLALDRFSVLQAEPPAGGTAAKRAARLKRHRVDCRSYYVALLRHVQQVLGERGTVSPIQEELLVARALERLVYRHFRLACLEAARRDSPARRFRWQVDGVTVTLWMPRWMSPGQCRRWLSDHVTGPGQVMRSARQQIQALIDRELNVHMRARGQADMFAEAVVDAVAEAAPSLVASQRVIIDGLAAAVAEEKIQCIEQQRDSIRRLGPRKLRRLIITIFGHVLGDSRSDAELAAAFNLSKTAYSHFAGSRWFANARRRVIPTLWKNTAQVIAANEAFAEAAKAAGVWDRVLATCLTWKEPRSDRHG
jgi:hypothetical protein